MKTKPVLIFLLISIQLFISCTDSREKSESTSFAKTGQRIWYKQHAAKVISDLLFESENRGWAISCGSGAIKGKLEFYNGTRWQQIDEFEDSFYPQIVKYNDSTLWYIVHESYTGNDRPRHFQIKNGIKSEIPIPKIMFDPTQYARFESIAVLDDGTAWMVGSQGNILFFDKKKWQIFDSPVKRKETNNGNWYEGNLTDVTMLDENKGFAVGVKGSIIKYKNGIWTKVKSPTTNKLNSIFMFDENNGWAVGLDGTILKCENSKWRVIPLPKFANLKTVKFANPELGWIVGFDNTFLEYDGGEWVEIQLEKQIKSHFLDIDFTVNKDGNIDLWLAAADGIYTTSQSYGFSFSNVTTQSSLREEGKCAHFFDANQDEYPDLIVQKDLGPAIFYTNHNGVFEEHALPTGNKGPAHAICTGDVNNDGYSDIFIFSKLNDFSLLLGKGNGKFFDYTKESGIHFNKISNGIVAAKFIDFNNDGNLDLYFSASRFKDYLFVNDGTGRFENRFNESNIIKEIPYIAYGPVFADFNNDSFIDILLTYTTPVKEKNCALFINEGHFKFHEKNLPECISKYRRKTISCAADDFNNDGNIDLYIFNTLSPPQLLLNNGSAEFEDVSAQYGFTDIIPYQAGSNGIVNFSDINNDGWKDIFVASKLFINEKGLALNEVSKFVGLDFSGNPSFADYDNDGDNDIFIGRSSSAFGKGVRAALFRNNLFEKKSAKIHLLPDESNRSAVGTKMILYQNDTIKYTQSVGIGNAPLVNSDFSSLTIPVENPANRLEVTFPGGEHKIIQNVSAGDDICVYESGRFTHYFILFYKSLLRTHKLINIRVELLKLLLFLAGFIFLIFRFRNLSKYQYIKNPLFIFAILLIYFYSVHFNILNGFTTYTIISFVLPIILGSVFILISAEIIKQKESKYIGAYKLLEMVGMGGMGKVYRALDSNKKREVALKVLNPELIKSAENKTRLSNEGKILASFDHPAIVKVFEIGETEEHTYVAMEFLPGGTLYDRIRETTPLEEKEITHLAVEIGNGLEAIHNNKCIHRDLKSHNIMFGDDGNIRIMDFGLSKAPLVSTMTTLGTVVGTLGYVAPEQITGLNIDHRVDIFSFGVIIYELLTGTLPFKGENEMALIHAIFNTNPPPPSSIRPDINEKWDNIVRRCLEKEVDKRYGSVSELRIDLEKIG